MKRLINSYGLFSAIGRPFAITDVPPVQKSTRSGKVEERTTVEKEMNYLKAFLSGFVSTFIFHQGLIAILYAIGFIPRVPFSLAPTVPFQIPQVISLAFWGGVWGIFLWLVIRRMTSLKYWLTALAFGAFLPSLVAWFVVSPLKGLPVAGGWKPANLVMALLLNGAWGIGVALLMKMSFSKRFSSIQ